MEMPMNEKFSHFTCSICGADYAPDEVFYTCPRDGGNLSVVLDVEMLKQQFSPKAFMEVPEASLWRYLNLLPVHNPGGYGTPLRRVGWTPVYKPDRLAKKLRLRNLWIKDESPNPTASFKDRASAIVVARAAQIGAETIVTASTGNAGAALAGMAAAVGAKAVIFAPKTAPPAKIAQLLVFGAKVLLVDGTYDQAFDLSIEATHHFGWYNRNTGFNPFTAEGKKTAAFEIWEQVIRTLPDDSRPLTVFIPVGDGNIISGVHKGFKDLQALGYVKLLGDRQCSLNATRVIELTRRGLLGVNVLVAEILVGIIPKCIHFPLESFNPPRIQVARRAIIQEIGKFLQGKGFTMKHGCHGRALCGADIQTVPGFFPDIKIKQP